MNGSSCYPTVLEYCRLCNEKKSSFVDIFSTMVYRDGCSLAKKLNELYGIEASSPDDDLSKFICIECLRQIMRHGNLTYNLWSTLDYLMRMHAEEVMDIAAYDIPEDSLDFLYSKEKDFSTQPLVLQKKEQPGGSLISSCRKKDGGSMAGAFMTEKSGSYIKEELSKVEFCWCLECNEEFISREELRLHSKKHAETETPDSFEQNDDLILSSEEYKLLCGEVSLLKNKLSCSKCQKEFTSEKKLVRHIKKYDFQCEHRSFVNLNNHLKSLKSKRAEDSALMDTKGKDSSFHFNSNLCEAKSPMTGDSLVNSDDILMNTKYINNGDESRVSGVDFKVKQKIFDGKLSSYVGSLPSSVSLCEQDPAVVKNCAKDGADVIGHEILTTEDKYSVAGTSVTKGAGSDVEEDELLKVEFCWCYECNEEFITREELRLHTKKHVETRTRDSFEQNEDLILSSEEYKLLSGEVSLLKNKLCCSKCQKEFTSEKKLVRHVKKYDFQCEHKSFVNLNNHLKSLKYKWAEDSALMDTQGRDSSFHVNSKLCETTSLVSRDSLENSNVNLINNKYNSDSGGDSIFGDIKVQVRQRKFGGKLSSYVGSLPSMMSVCKRDETIVKNCATEVAEIVNHEILKTEINMSERMVICHYCTKPYSLKSKLRDHIVVCHLSAVSHKCSICHLFFPTQSELNDHEAIHFSKSKYICSLCYSNFQSKAKVVVHSKNVHNVDKAYTCSACFLSFPSVAELSLHHHCHSSNKKYCCSMCGKSFMSRIRYDIHISVCQSGQRLHKCGTCGKEYLTRGDLKFHMLTHDPEKRFACHLCPKSYTQPGKLSLHIRNFHMKIKLHECGICKRRFAVRRYLNRHYAVHSDHRPFKCKYCEKYFKTKDGVYSHTRKVHI
ncbi:zinc finger protein 432-like [Ischnura elegans]|uniref:zinc finger protein 432-like n=1 Tax=Ischnura elegans TaxID=197161 RepID=UPI001ED8B4CA|nr:zinc finger protein 432-like [Ischnura elegans]